MRFSTWASSIAALAVVAVAQHHHHHHHHARAHVRPRSVSSLDGARVTVVDNSRTETTEVPEIVVFVDQNGNPVSTAQAVVVLVPPSSATGAEQTKVAQQSSFSTAPLKPAADSSQSPANHAPPSSALPVEQAPGSSSSPAPADTQPASKAGGGTKYSVAYAPYSADGSCKSAEQVMADFTTLAPDYGIIRVYSVDCDQVPKVVAAAKANNLMLFMGIFSLDNLGDQVATMSKAVNGDWSFVDTISVGNELVNNGQASPKQVIDAMTAAKKLLRDAGYNGPVVTVDTFVAVLAHPELCQASDYCAANIHPFFDPNTVADQAGVFVANMIQAIRTKLGDPSARVVVTESGWPWQGSANSQAVPGVDQQQKAVASIKAAFASNPADVFIFSAFNDMWKKAEAVTHYAEQYWGVDARNAPTI